MIRFTAPVLLAATMFAGATSASAKTPDGKPFILLLAGRPSHGPGQHEHNAGVQLFAKCLAQGAPQVVRADAPPAVHRQQGQFDKAREAYEQAIALAPDYAAPMLNLGILNDLYLGDSRRALVLYERYLELSPAGDVQVSKWVVDLHNRRPQQVAAKGKDTP